MLRETERERENQREQERQHEEQTLLLHCELCRRHRCADAVVVAAVVLGVLDIF